MAQRDKVKELVGRSLNSYHAKALQQIERIEKKNKEQNHKISILSNELDNDYLTKTEEGSVISLEHSKEGMVYLDELQGNTLVNYCTDGSKEITLNGDIDVEGVDNVYNVIIKPNTLYTVALDTNKTGTIRINLGGAEVTTTNNVAMITTPETLTDNTLKLYGTNIKCSKVRLLEGDKTNWMPSFFEGMKSSFEDKLQDDGSYKMEILMNNKNLFDANCFKDLSKWNVCMGSSSWKYYPIYIGKNKKAYIKRVYKDNLSDYPMVIISKDKDYGMNVGGWIPIIHGNATEKVYKGSILPDANGFIYLLTSYVDYNKLVATIENCIISTVDVDYIEQKSNKIQFSSIEPLRKWDRFAFKDGQLMIERYSKKVDLGVEWSSKQQLNTGIYRYTLNNIEGIYSMAETICNTITTVSLSDTYDKVFKYFTNTIWYQTYDDFTLEELREYFTNSNTSLIFKLKEPTYEEIPYDLQKIILEGYENGTLFFDTNIPPTATITYAGETPIVKSTKLNKTEVSNNTADINDNILPYLMDMDYRIVMLQLATEELEGEVSMARLFGGTYEMLKRDILSKRLSRQEYGYRLADYFNAGKLTEEQVRELEELR